MACIETPSALTGNREGGRGRNAATRNKIEKMGQITIRKLRPALTPEMRQACADRAFRGLIESAIAPPHDYVVVLRPSACPRYIAKPWGKVDAEKEREWSAHMSRADALQCAEDANCGRYWG